MIKKFNLNMWISTSEDGIHWEYRPNRNDILEKINELIDAVNAFEPKRGRWIDEKCSVCNYNVEPWNVGTNYCPNCGADMRGGEDD